MIRRGQQALSAAAAGACLALCACGSGSAPAADGSSGYPASGAGTPTASAGAAIRGTSHFCRKASSFMGKIPPPPTGHVTVASARANLSTVLQTTVRGFTELRAESPHSLHRPLKKIIAVYRADEKAVRSASSISQLSAAMVKHNEAIAADFGHLLKYIAATCR
jgi:hypothetical protein